MIRAGGPRPQRPCCRAARLTRCVHAASWLPCARRSPAVESALLQGLLVKLMAAGAPDGARVGEALRSLLQAAPSDADRLRLYR